MITIHHHCSLNGVHPSPSASSSVLLRRSSVSGSASFHSIDVSVFHPHGPAFRSYFIVRHPSFVVHHPSSVVRHFLQSPFVRFCSWFTVRFVLLLRFGYPGDVSTPSRYHRLSSRFSFITPPSRFFSTSASPLLFLRGVLGDAPAWLLTGVATDLRDVQFSHYSSASERHGSDDGTARMAARLFIQINSVDRRCCKLDQRRRPLFCRSPSPCFQSLFCLAVALSLAPITLSLFATSFLFIRVLPLPLSRALSLVHL